MKTTNQAIVVDTTDIICHPNANSLSVIRSSGYNIVVKTSDWDGVDKGIFIPPENLVDTERPEFAFLHRKRQWEKVKVMRLRGFISAGLLIPALPDDNVGDDVTERLGILHDDPEAQFEGRDQVKPPLGQLNHLPKYDIDSFAKLYQYFSPNDEIVATVKIHGTNCRYVWSPEDDRFFAGSRTQWVADNTIHYRPAKTYPGIIDFCRENPGYILCGEAYGMQGGNYNYGLPPNMHDFRAFDIRKPDFQFVDYDDFIKFCLKYTIPMVDAAYIGKFTNLEFLKQFAEGPDPLCSKTPREGCVVKLTKERRAESGDRMTFKIIGSGYKA